jgi:hypothetical protein
LQAVDLVADLFSPPMRGGFRRFIRRNRDGFGPIDIEVIAKEARFSPNHGDFLHRAPLLTTTRVRHLAISRRP